MGSYQQSFPRGAQLYFYELAQDLAYS